MLLLGKNGNHCWADGTCLTSAHWEAESGRTAVEHKAEALG